MERELPRNFFGKLGYTSRGCPLFWKFWTILFHSLLKVAENLNRTFRLNGKCFWFRGGSRIFFRTGCTRLLPYFNPSINHIVFFFWQNNSCIRKPQAISGGRGVRTPCTLPQDPPLWFPKWSGRSTWDLKLLWPPVIVSA